MTKTLTLTHDQVRQRQVAPLRTVPNVGDGTPVRWPQPWWPQGPRSSYCLGWQTIQLGLRTGHESAAWLNAHQHMTSIGDFRAHYQWHEVGPGQIEAGDLVLSNWTGTRVDGDLEAEHIEWAYSAARDSVRIVGANTGPEPGVADPNGIWRKTRRLDVHILGGIRPPYKPEAPSRARRHEVAVVAALVNDVTMPGLGRATAADTGPDYGLEGPTYWRRVQTWGRAKGYYGSRFVIDGIPGPQSRIVEAAAYRAATAKK